MFEELPEAIEPSLQHLPVGLDPSLGVLQASGSESASTSPPGLLGGDELDVLQDPHVLLHPGQGHLERLRELGDGRAALAKPLEDAPARGVRERREGSVEFWLILNHIVQYSERTSRWVLVMTLMKFRILSWNVAGRVRRQPEQARALTAGEWDVVCLQEVTPTTLKAWRLALAEQGMVDVQTSIDDWIPGDPPPEGRRLGVLIAARWPLEVITSAHPPWPERLLSARVAADRPFDVHNLHSPISQRPDRVKVRTHRALHAYLERAPDLPQVLVGDLNTPRRELPSGVTWSFARDSHGTLRLDRGERWEHAELALLRGLEGQGLRDVYRDLHGYARQEISWSYPRRRGGYRLDHVIASKHLDPIACEYLHPAREAGLSDHAPVWAELGMAGD